MSIDATDSTLTTGTCSEQNDKIKIHDTFRNDYTIIALYTLLLILYRKSGFKLTKCWSLFIDYLFIWYFTFLKKKRIIIADKNVINDVTRSPSLTWNGIQR